MIVCVFGVVELDAEVLGANNAAQFLGGCLAPSGVGWGVSEVEEGRADVASLLC